MYNIVIADDHDLVRDTIAAYLSKEGSFTIHTASDFGTAFRLANNGRVTHLAILDYNMAGMDGLSGIQRMKEFHPNTKIILMSGVASLETARSAIDMGADGFVPKSMSALSMINAIKFVLAGEKYFPAELSEGSNAPKQGGFMGLTDREAETLRFVCKGMSNKEIAREMGLQEVTIKLHVKNILKKLGATNLTQAALIAQNNGFE